MLNYLFVCRSLTYAQQTARVLTAAKIKASVIRSPFDVSGDGCGYSVKVPEGQAERAMVQLQNNRLLPLKVYVQYPDGHYLEVTM